MNLNLSERDKKLLLFLAILCIICVPYFFIIQPYMDKNAALETEITELQSQKRYLTDLALNEAVYEEQTKEAVAETLEIMAKFPSDLPQEASILFIDNTEKTIPIKLHQVTFGEDVAAQLTSDAEAEQIQAVEQEMGYESDQPVVEEKSETVAISGDLNGLETETQFAFEAGYEEWKEFLDYIANYRDRMVITGMTATYTLDEVVGNFTLKQYAIAGDGRLPVSILEPNLMHGTTNVFLKAAGIGNAKSDAADFFMMLSGPDADVDAVIVGQSNDAAETTYLSSDENLLQEVTVRFEGKDGQYVAHYEVGDESYSEEGVTFAKKGAIVFEIISSPRTGENDKVGARLNIVNNTDVTVSVKILDDDAENPRLDIAEQTGVIALQ